MHRSLGDPQKTGRKTSAEDNAGDCCGFRAQLYSGGNGRAIQRRPFGSGHFGGPHFGGAHVGGGPHFGGAHVGGGPHFGGAPFGGRPHLGGGHFGGRRFGGAHFGVVSRLLLLHTLPRITWRHLSHLIMLPDLTLGALLLAATIYTAIGTAMEDIIFTTADGGMRSHGGRGATATTVIGLAFALRAQDMAPTDTAAA